MFKVYKEALNLKLLSAMTIQNNIDMFRSLKNAAHLEHYLPLSYYKTQNIQLSAELSVQIFT